MSKVNVHLLFLLLGFSYATGLKCNNNNTSGAKKLDWSGRDGLGRERLHNKEGQCHV